MKRYAVFAVGLAVLAAACKPPVEAGPPIQDRCPVVLRFAEAAAAGSRTVLPAASAAIASYSLSAVGPGGAALELGSKEPWLRAELPPGDWSFQAGAANAAGLVLLVGSAEVRIEGSAARDVAIALSPRPGLGILRTSLAVDPAVPAEFSVSLELSDLSGSSVAAAVRTAPFELWEAAALPAGYYRLCATAAGGAAPRGVSEIVRVLPDTVTACLVDFASAPGQVAFRLSAPDLSPLEPRLPAWCRWSSARPRSLAAAGSAAGTGLQPDAAAAWFLDGAPLAQPELPVGALAAGLRRIDLAARDALGRRAGSASRSVAVYSGAAAGAWSWTGAFAADPVLAAGLPAGFGFLDSAAAAGAVVAVDGAKGSTAASSLHWFRRAPMGDLYAERVAAVRPAGTTRAADRVVLAPDASAAAAWKTDGTWIAVHNPDGAVRVLDQAGLGLADALKLRGAAFAADGATLYLLASAPNRIVAVSLGAAGPTAAWCRTLEAAPANASWSGLAADGAGRLLAWSTAGDAVRLIEISGGTSVEFRSADQPWLEAPIDASGRADGGFFVLAQGFIGKIESSGTAAGLTGAAVEADLVDAARLGLSPDEAWLAAGGSRSGAAAVLTLRPVSGGVAVRFAETAELPGLAASGTPVWPAPGEVLVPETAARRLGAFALGP